MIIEGIRKSAGEFPAKTAIIYHEHKISYAKLEEITNRLASGLKKLGVRAGDRVALIMPNFPHFVFSYYAILKSGAIIVPINYMCEHEEFDLILENVKPQVIIYWEGFRRHIRNYLEFCGETPIMVVLGTPASMDNIDLLKLISQSQPELEPLSFRNEDTAVIQFTSGVTELPKGIELSYHNLSASANACIKFFRFNETDVFGAFLPLYFIFSQNLLLTSALLKGATIVLHSKIDYQAIIQAIVNHHISVLAGSPNFYHVLLESGNPPGPGLSLKYCLSSWHSLPEELEAKFEQTYGVPLLNCYSITETGGIVSSNHPSIERRAGSVGLALPDIDIQVHDEQGELLDHDEIGEIAVQGRNVMKGYWNSPELTTARLKHGWFYTGDLGKIDDLGNIFLVNKKAEIIVKSGFPIYTSEIEHILLKHPKVKEAVVMAIPHPGHIEDVQACIALKDNETATAEEIIEFCRTQMPVYKCPQVVKFYPALPRTRMGRIFKRKLRENSTTVLS